MFLTYPIKNITDPIAPSFGSIYISQKFGNVWIADRDMVINGVSLKKGDNVYKKAFSMDGHNGLDIAAPRFTPIYAPCDGYIVEANGGAGYGNRVLMLTEEGDKQYVQVFGHLDNWLPLPKIKYNLKNKNNLVKRGDKIGEVDSTGFSTGDHCHWGLYIYKNYIKQDINNGYQGAIDPVPFTKNYMNDHVKIINYKGTIFIGVGAEDVAQAVSLGKAFGREVQVDGQGNITNADIKID